MIINLFDALPNKVDAAIMLKAIGIKLTLYKRFENLGIKNKGKPNLFTFLEGVMKGSIVIQAKVTAEPNECFCIAPILGLIQLLCRRQDGAVRLRS